MNVWVVVKSKFINSYIENLERKYDTENLKKSEIVGVFANEDDARDLQEELLPCYDDNGNEMDAYIESWEVK